MIFLLRSPQKKTVDSRRTGGFELFGFAFLRWHYPTGSRGHPNHSIPGSLSRFSSPSKSNLYFTLLKKNVNKIQLCCIQTWVIHCRKGRDQGGSARAANIPAGSRILKSPFNKGVPISAVGTYNSRASSISSRTFPSASDVSRFSKAARDFGPPIFPRAQATCPRTKGSGSSSAVIKLGTESGSP
jgi:hypothetical protein